MRARGSYGSLWLGLSTGLLGILLLAGAAGAAAPEAAGDAKATADRILEESGTSGGLIVHLDCGDGRLTAALRSADNCLVHGLACDAADVARARRHVASLGLDGVVSVEQHAGERLPYNDNLVNLLVTEAPLSVSMDEVLRVLAPGGVVCLRQDGRWSRTVKPWPDEIDQWTHFLYDASGNAVAGDRRVGPPRHMQWLADPLWARNHHTLASISAVVSAQGRLFLIVDEGPAASMDAPGKWFLVARDAFNGTLLWKKPIATWAWTKQGFRSGPVQLPRTLVACGDRVYAPLEMSGAVAVMDAASGRILRVLDATEGAEEIILDEGLLVAVTGKPLAEQGQTDPARRKLPFPNEKTIVATDPETGKLQWKWADSQSARLMPLTLAAQAGRVVFQAGSGVVCLDAKTGDQLWRYESPKANQKNDSGASAKTGGKKKQGKRRKGSADRRPGWSVATLVLNDSVVLRADRGRLAALGADDGKLLWECPTKPGFRSPVDVLVVGSLVWLGPDFSKGRDLRTGVVQAQNDVAAGLWTIGHHHRCYREKATERYILTGKRGIEMIDLVADQHSRNNWVRGVCQYGIMPCNGLIYAPSHACGCYMESKLYGFWAVAPEREAEGEKRKAESKKRPRLERGPAFGRAADPSSLSLPSSMYWPTYRHDVLRSGTCDASLAARLEPAWEIDLGGRPSAPVVGRGIAVVSMIDAHRVVAVDVASGRKRWSFTTGGRVDSPPTLHRGFVLFGSADGWVYCLWQEDGRLVWRFRAAPEERKTVARDRLESIWPVHGSVLVLDDVAYCAAGRSSFLDGGIYLYALEPETGRVLATRCIQTAPAEAAKNRDPRAAKTMFERFAQNATDDKTFLAPDRSDAFSMGGARNDVLVSDGAAVYMHHLRFDPELAVQQPGGRHLFSTSSLLDGAEVHRSHWVLGTSDFSRLPVAYSWIANRQNGAYGSRLSVPYGLLLTFNEQSVCGVRRGGRKGGYTLFGEANSPLVPNDDHLPDFRSSDGKRGPDWTWNVELPMRPRAMLRAGNLLVLGGTSTDVDSQDPLGAYEGRQGGVLWSVSVGDGRRLGETKLEAPPVWDGMAATSGRLYVSTTDGKLICLRAAGKPRP